MRTLTQSALKFAQDTKIPTGGTATARVAQADVFDPLEVSAFHCINCCVHRCFLCGDDPLTGANYDHRKAWLEQRLQFLAGQYGIDGEAARDTQRSWRLF